MVRAAAPDILIEDDCESLGLRAAKEVMSQHLRGLLRRRMGSVAVAVFGGIDHLPGTLPDLALLAGP